MSPHRALNQCDAEMWNKLPGRMHAVENRVEALVASCRECRVNRERWESGMAREFAEFRQSITAAVLTGLARLEKKFTATPTKRRLKSRG